MTVARKQDRRGLPGQLGEKAAPAFGGTLGRDLSRGMRAAASISSLSGGALEILGNRSHQDWLICTATNRSLPSLSISITATERLSSCASFSALATSAGFAILRSLTRSIT